VPAAARALRTWGLALDLLSIVALVRVFAIAAAS